MRFKLSEDFFPPQIFLRFCPLPRARCLLFRFQAASGSRFCVDISRQQISRFCVPHKISFFLGTWFSNTFNVCWFYWLSRFMGEDFLCLFQTRGFSQFGDLIFCGTRNFEAGFYPLCVALTPCCLLDWFHVASNFFEGHLLSCVHRPLRYIFFPHYRLGYDASGR